MSVVVPSFQKGRFLRHALDSILSQDWPTLEVLVLDGGSTDGSVDVLRSYGDRIWYRSHPDGGQSSAINEGFRRSRGQFVAWLNADDVYYPGAVRHAVATLREHPDAALVYGEGDLIDEHGAVLHRFPETVPFDLWRLANVADYILQPTVFFRREAIEGVEIDERLQWGLDWDLWLRLGARHPLVRTPRVLAASRVYSDTKTASGGVRRLRELLAILRAHGVPRRSPAAAAHTASTLVRALRPSTDRLSAREVSKVAPPGLRWALEPMLRSGERRLRRWLQNAQGVWPDRLVARRGHLWLPSDGEARALRIGGRNLGHAGQRVRLSVGKHAAHTHRLDVGEPFTLEVPVAAGLTPVKAAVRCARTERVAALDPTLGPRRAGWALDRRELVF